MTTLNHLLTIITNDGSIASHLGISVEEVRKAREAMVSKPEQARFTTHRHGIDNDETVAVDTVAVKADRVASDQLKHACLDAIHNFADRYNISFKDARTLLLNTGVRL